MKHKSFLGILVIALTALCFLSCGSSVQAPKAPDGGPLTMVLAFDRGLEGKTQDQQNQLNQVGDFMEPNLIQWLRDAGYATEIVPGKEAFTPAPGKYLLAVKIVNYNPGSKAARMLVGFGAGSGSLDVRYELMADPTQPIHAKEHGRASSRDWKPVCRRVNKDIVEDITNKLNLR